MQSESKKVAVSEVSTRNEILNDSVEKLKLEILNIKKTLSKVENEKIDIEKEGFKLKGENRKIL
jgi:hypothetical protein